MWVCYNALMKHILALCLFVPLFASAQTFSLNADWRFRKAPVTIPLAQAAALQMTAWCLLQAPLIVSCDLKNLKPETKAILCDETLLAIDQDEAMIPAEFSGDLTGGGVLVVTKRLSDGRTVRGEFDFTTADVKLIFESR